MKQKLTVVKLGGNSMDEPLLLHQFLLQFAKMEGHKILVHGGGKIASTLGRKLGIVPNMVEGRRVTDEATIDLVTMVYAGLLNKKIVAQLCAGGCNAIGLSGADGNLILSHKRNPEPVDFGLVGDPVAVNEDLLSGLLDKNYVPVIAPITHDAQGQLLNTNADTIASVVSSAMSNCFEVHLIFAFEKQGVLENPDIEESVIPELSLGQFSQLKQSGKIHSGMLPKLSAGFFALENNVQRVTITNVNTLIEPNIRTLLTL